jgi:hypothetical protein
MSKNLDACFSHAGIALVMTCGACPEQYDAFDGQGRQVGYLRLRHGYFRVHSPSISNDIVYETYTKGDGFFEDDEREEHLIKACEAIRRAKLNRYLDKR